MRIVIIQSEFIHEADPRSLRLRLEAFVDAENLPGGQLQSQIVALLRHGAEACLVPAKILDRSE